MQIPEADVGVRYVTTWKVAFQVKNSKSKGHEVEMGLAWLENSNEFTMAEMEWAGD